MESSGLREVPEFPPTVNAGVDRDVILGGKTYLRGRAKSLRPDTAEGRLVWSKQSGPGNVSFADANAAETTATFSEPASMFSNSQQARGACALDLP